MCTVTRPGLASIAASTAVELLVSMIQHPAGCVSSLSLPSPPLLSLVTEPLYNISIHAPPPPLSTKGEDNINVDINNGVLGQVPHQLRGFLAQSFRNMPIVGAAYGRCTGCSETVRSPLPSSP